ncbi:MAG: transcriptional regulator, partial [Bacteroidota bacterium]
QALTLSRELIADGRAQPASLTNIFYAYLATCRELDEPERMRPYLDSVRRYHAPTPGLISATVLDSEEAFLLGKSGATTPAITLYEQIIPWYQANNPSYLTLVYTYLGDIYSNTGDYARAENYYREALAVSERTNSHHDFSPIIHRQLANLYQQQGDYRAATASLERFVALDDRFFDSRSPANRPLLEIQDDYRTAMEKRAREAREEKLKRLERESQLQYFKTAALSFSIVLLLLLAILSFLYLRANHRTEKKLLRQERALELAKANEIVDLKNKELAASTLKLIAKDEFITDIQERLARFQAEPNAGREINTILRNIRSNTDNGENWQAFEARFVAVNQNFYQTLKERYPKLTQGDLKLCALIKLNFSSKDIARLMGISVESVHTTRYRLRKKLGLKRKDNLGEFIAGV